MKEKNRRETAPTEEQYRPELNRGTVCMLIGIAAALAGDTALYFKWWAVGLLCYVVLLISVVWLVKESRRKDRSDYEQWRRMRKALKEVEDFEDRLDTVETNLDLKADKPARSNIRPGSVQSETFKRMMEDAE